MHVILLIIVNSTVNTILLKRFFTRRALFVLFAIYLSTFLSYPNAMVPIFLAFSFSSFSCRPMLMPLRPPHLLLLPHQPNGRVNSLHLYLSVIYHRNFRHSLCPDAILRCPNRMMQAHRLMVSPINSNRNEFMNISILDN